MRGRGGCAGGEVLLLYNLMCLLEAWRQMLTARCILHRSPRLRGELSAGWHCTGLMRARTRRGSAPRRPHCPCGPEERHSMSEHLRCPCDHQTLN